MIENFGRYQLVERIALGGFAEIFRAHAVGIAGFEKTLAIKRLHPRYSQDSDFIAWMVDEAKITSQLSHANICQVLDFAKVDGHYFIAMEYISGRDVYRIMKKLRETKAPAPIELVAFVGREACAGLDYTHRKRDAEGDSLDIVHRDMSPQNVMVSLDGDVKIIDFGIAKSRARGYETEAGIIKGKFFYMSPEQARGEELDSGTDIFSLGIVLWELVTGELLYKDDDEVTLLSQVRRAAINPPNTIRQEIPDGLNRIIVKALSRNRDDRYTSAFEMQKDLERFLIRHNSKYGKDQVGYWMRSTFYEDLPAKEVQNIDSFRHRADFIAEERSLIGQVYAAEDMTRPQQEGDSGLFELGSDMIQPADSLSSSSVVISQGIGAGEEFFDDAVTAAVDSIIPDDVPMQYAQSAPIVQHNASPEIEAGYQSRGEPRNPVVQAAPRPSNADAAPWSQKAAFEHSATEVGEVSPPSNGAKAAPVGSELLGQAQRTLSPLMHTISGQLNGRFKQERVYVAIILLVIMGGAVALTAHLKSSKTAQGISTSEMSSQGGFDDDNCQEYVLKDGKKICAQAKSRTSAAPSTLVIRTNPSGATVFINEDRHSGKTPTTVSLSGKSRARIMLSLPNYQTVNETVQMPGNGKRLIVERTLEKPLGTLVVTSNPAGAKITLDLEYKGRTPNTIGNLRLDRTQVLRIERDGFKSQTRSISWTETGKSVERNLQFDLARVVQPTARKVAPRKKKRRARRPKKRRTPTPRVIDREERTSKQAPAPEPKRTKGKIRVQTRPWATVSLDGRALGDAPTEKSVLEGNYRLKVCFEGDRSRCVVRRITVNGNRETTERFRE